MGESSLSIQQSAEIVMDPKVTGAELKGQNLISTPLSLGNNV